MVVLSLFLWCSTDFVVVCVCVCIVFDIHYDDTILELSFCLYWSYNNYYREKLQLCGCSVQLVLIQTGTSQIINNTT